MRVLAAILSHARDVSLDVARIQIRLVEGWLQQLDQRLIPAHQMLIHRGHGQARALGIARPGQHRPALRNRIDPAFGVTRRPQRRAVVEVGAAVPCAVPAMLFELLAQPGRLLLTPIGEGQVIAPARDYSELHEHVVEEKAHAPHFVAAKYGQLNEAEIKTLVVDDKWLAALAAAVQSELDRVSQALTGRIRQLAERYAVPLPALADEVDTLAARVDEHLKKMRFVW